jgi:hypothetical protein
MTRTGPTGAWVGVGTRERPSPLIARLAEPQYLIMMTRTTLLGLARRRECRLMLVYSRGEGIHP